MGRWIDERAWMVSMYICYILCFIILSVAGYNYTLKMIGDTTLFMKVVILICICLFVALGVSLLFSIFITPLSELLNRMLFYMFRRKKDIILSQASIVLKEEKDGNTLNEGDSESDNSVGKEEKNGKIDNDNSQREALKKEFMEKYVRHDFQAFPIYDVFESLFNQQQSGAFAARAFKCAMSEPIKWLKSFPGYEDAKRLFPLPDAIKGSKSNYSNANNKRNYSDDTIEETVSVLRDKLEELTVSLGEQKS